MKTYLQILGILNAIAAGFAVQAGCFGGATALGLLAIGIWIDGAAIAIIERK